MARLKMKLSNTRDPNRKAELLEMLSYNDIYITKLFSLNDDFVMIAVDQDQDKLFQQKTNMTFNPLYQRN